MDTLSLHVAEYSALRSRATNLDIMSSTVWGFIIAILVFCLTNWSRVTSSAGRAWGALLLLQTLFCVVSSFINETYTMIGYVETELRALVQEEVGAERRFWQYEPSLARQRTNALSVPWEVGIFLADCVFFIGTLCARLSSWTNWDYFFLLVSLSPMGFLLWSAAQLKRKRRVWSAPTKA